MSRDVVLLSAGLSHKARRAFWTCFVFFTFFIRAKVLMIELLGKSKEELREFCAALGQPAYRANQIYHALYSERKFNFGAMSNLPAPLRERLAAETRITLPTVRQRYVSADGS